MLINMLKLITAYQTIVPDPLIPEQRIAFDTSGHHGSASKTSANGVYL
jgi:phosphoglucomutase